MLRAWHFGVFALLTGFIGTSPVAGEDYSRETLRDEAVKIAAALRAGAAGDGPFGPSMLGLQVGLDIAQAEDILRNNLAVGAVFGTEFKRDEGVIAKVFTNVDASDRVALLGHASVPGKLVAVSRRIDLPLPTPDKDQLDRLIRNQFGQWTYADDFTWVWTDAPEASAWPCDEELGELGLRKVDLLEGDVVQRRNERGKIEPGFANNNWIWAGTIARLPVDKKYESCAALLSIHANLSGDAPSLTFFLHDGSWLHSRVAGSGAAADSEKALADLLGGAAGAAPGPLADPLAGWSAGDIADGRKAFRAGQYQDAIAVALPLARQGDPQALVLLGDILADSGGGLYNPAEAVPLFRLAASAGNVEAFSRLGNAYREGIAVEESLPLALEWYHKGAEAGDASAMLALALLYDSGKEVSPDKERAREWMEGAADLGDPDAQRLLAEWILEEGGTEGRVEALALLRRSADQGDEAAADAYETLLGTIERDDEERARLEEARRKEEQARAEAERRERQLATVEESQEISPGGDEVYNVGEPTEDDMRQAITSYFDAVNAQMAETMSACRNGDFRENAVLAMQCLAGMVAAGDEHSAQFEITRFEKVACAPASGQAGFVCDYVLGYRGGGGMSSLGLDGITAAGSRGKGRFLPVGSGWDFLPMD